MSSEIDLNGEWSLRGVGESGPARHELTATAVVPGAVHHDRRAEHLMRAGIIPDPFWRDNAEQCQWVERWGWTFRREFEVPQDWPFDWSVLELQGLDTYATVRVNGQVVGEAANMFVPHRFEVGPALRPGRNEIEVHFPPHHTLVADKPFGLYLSVFSADRVFSRKMQCGFGWDWVHRLVNVGLWRPATLRGHRQARIDDLYVRTVELEGNGGGRATLAVELSCELRGPVGSLRGEVEIVDPAGRVVATRTLEALQADNRFELVLESPQLWWPNGHGAQPLYRCRAVVRDASASASGGASGPSSNGTAGAERDRREITFGIRTVKIEQPADEKGTGLIFAINGRRVFAKGGNWVPPDPFPGTVEPQRYHRLLKLAADAHCNMMRAWGGGVYEPPAFWDACNRLGIMVWQDFQMACAYYPEDRVEFMDAMRAEAPAAVRMLRNHPSLVIWCGDNEDGMNWSPQSNYPGKKLATEITGPAVARLAPDVPFWPTSPYGGEINKSPDSGDCHKSVVYDMSFYKTDMRDYRRRIDELPGRFLSESTTVGAPPKHSLLKFMTEQDVFADPDERMWHYHTKDNPCNPGVHHYHMLRDAARNLFGRTDDPEQELRHKEYWQYEVTRLTIEATRRRWPHCGGLLFWMYNDCWPASGWSMVDYYGFAKAAYHAMRRAFAPVIASIRADDDSVGLWVCNDGPAVARGTLHARVQPFAEPDARWELKLPFEVPAGTSVELKRLARSELRGLGADSLLVCDAHAGANSDRATWYPGIPAEMPLPRVRLNVHRHPEPGGRGGLVRVQPDGYARVVTLAGDADYSDNYFDLLPGESRTVRWTAVSPSWAAAAQAVVPPRGPEVGCWNGDVEERRDGVELFLADGATRAHRDREPHRDAALAPAT